ncbi:MAG: TIGR03667 family PPOX class F420-dependent oxidoreductase [Chloroflexota bacterium]
MIDTNTEFGQRVLRRLEEDQIIWLTTVSKKGIAQPRPIWFLWEDDTVMMYSQPNTFKLGHIKRNPHVALNFNGDDHGGDIIVFTGVCEVDEKAPRADDHAAFIEKYQTGIKRINMTPKSFSDTYSVAIRATLSSLRGH